MRMPDLHVQVLGLPGCNACLLTAEYASLTTHMPVLESQLSAEGFSQGLWKAIRFKVNCLVEEQQSPQSTPLQR